MRTGAAGDKAAWRRTATFAARLVIATAFGCLALLPARLAAAQESEALLEEQGVETLHSGRRDRDRLFVREKQPLEFGRVVAHPTLGGAVLISAANGSRSVGAGAAALGSGYGPAIFLVVGPPNARFSITLPERVDFPGLGNGSNITDMKSYPERYGKLDHHGKAEIKVGGRLNIGNGPYPGDLRSTSFSLDVDLLERRRHRDRDRDEDKVVEQGDSGS